MAYKKLKIKIYDIMFMYVLDIFILTAVALIRGMYTKCKLLLVLIRNVIDLNYNSINILH